MDQLKNGKGKREGIGRGLYRLKIKQKKKKLI